jgi:soluble lytic murein transglycosylase-like protein
MRPIQEIRARPTRTTVPPAPRGATADSPARGTIHRRRAVRRSLGRAAVVALCLFEALAARGEPLPICEQQMTRAAAAYDIPLEILYSVGLTETGSRGTLNPYDMNVDGRAVHSSNLNEALARFALERSRGAKLIDIGCMQINHRWHASHFRSLEEMFDPEHNVQYAASYLKSLYREAASWTLAVARYNAGPGNPQAQRTYVCAVIANMVASGEGRWTPNARAFCGRDGKTG